MDSTDVSRTAHVSTADTPQPNSAAPSAIRVVPIALTYDAPEPSDRVVAVTATLYAVATALNGVILFWPVCTDAGTWEWGIWRARSINTAWATIALLAAYSWATAWFIRHRCRREPTDRETRVVLGFWTISPPLWYFVEYYVLQNYALPVYGAENGEPWLGHVRHYQTLATNVWAAILLILAVAYTRQLPGIGRKL